MKIAALALIALAAVASVLPHSWADPAPAATACPYCRALLSADEFCPRCGRLVGMESTAASGRFWGDVPYLVQFPPSDADPTISSKISDAGIVQETVSLRAGDRYTWTPGPDGAVVEGRVSFGRSSKESRLRATIRDTVVGNRLIAREVLGEISGSPNLHLRRTLDYVYTTDGLLATVKFGTWFYSSAADRKKRPGEWTKHAVGEIALVRQDGRLTRIATTLREGRRSLRGEPDYADARTTVESVQRAPGGAIDRLVTTTRAEESR